MENRIGIENRAFKLIASTSEQINDCRIYEVSASVDQ